MIGSCFLPGLFLPAFLSFLFFLSHFWFLFDKVCVFSYKILYLNVDILVFRWKVSTLLVVLVLERLVIFSAVLSKREVPRLASFLLFQPWLPHSSSPKFPQS